MVRPVSPSIVETWKECGENVGIEQRRNNDVRQNRLTTAWNSTVATASNDYVVVSTSLERSQFDASRSTPFFYAFVLRPYLSGGG